MEHATVNEPERLERLKSLNANMGYLSAMGMWRDRAVTVDTESWRGLLSDVFVCITQELGDAKTYPSEQQARDIVAQLNQDELEELKSAVRNGVEEDNWTDLVEYLRLKK